MADPLFSDTSRTPHTRIWAIAGPAILANSSTPLVGLVDTWAVGHLPNAIHLAAVGLGTVIFNFLLFTFGFLRMGTTGLVAQARGKGDKAALTRIVLRSCALALFFGLVLMLFQELILALSLRALAPPQAVAEIAAEYFRIRIWAAPGALLVFAVSGVLFGLGRARPVLALQLLLNIVNGALNVLFVVGMGMGVPGVALGTLIAQWLAALASLWILADIFGREALLSALRSAQTWLLDRFRQLIVLNGFIFIRTVMLMIALSLIMRVSGGLGEKEMAASHVINQYFMLMALGLDGFAHAAEALAGAAWGEGRLAAFRRWVWLTGAWAVVASLAYALIFWLGGNALTGLLTDLPAVRRTVAELMLLIIIMPVVAVWCFHFDGVYIGITAAVAMMVTMGIAFTVCLALLRPMAGAWGLAGRWGAVLVFLAVRGATQALWYFRLIRNNPSGPR
jgi:MATE family multidrug resistance protein